VPRQCAALLTKASAIEEASSPDGDREKPWEVRQGIENLSRRVDGLSLEDLAGNDLMRTFVTWTTVP